jgi:hypothetical protein
MFNYVSLYFCKKYEFKMRVRFDVLTAASNKVIVFWDVAPRSLVETDECSRGAYCLRHQGDESKRVIIKIGDESFNVVKFWILILKVVTLCSLRMKEERMYSSYSFFTSALKGVSGQRQAPSMFYPQEKDLQYPLDTGWVRLRAGLGTEARGNIISPCRGSNAGRPVCSQSLY